MRTVRRLAFIVAVILALAAVPAWAQGPKGCQSMAGSLAASVDPMVGWQGPAFLTVGDQAPVAGTIVDTPPAESRPHPVAPNEKGLWGAERYFFTFPDGTLTMEVDFVGVPSQAPFLGNYNASGKIVAGTGRYLGASGNVTAHGPFIFYPPTFTTAWIAELKGTICGVQ